MRIPRRLIAITAAGLVAATVAAGPAGARHSWGRYHWARASNPFTLLVGDNVNNTWDSSLNLTLSDWSQSSVLDLKGTSGSAGSNCSPTSGRVEVCNGNYGATGWLGIAQVWLGFKQHIGQGVVKNNDYYFNQDRYNSSAWRNMVMCQEVGHTLGLDHQDENFNNANLGTCMDYTNSPESNQHPNAHDYAMLASIYGHSDGFSTIGSSTAQQASAGAASAQAEWGQAIRFSSDGLPSLYERDLGSGARLLTFVIWAQ